jgi:hypothetical protein
VTGHDWPGATREVGKKRFGPISDGKTNGTSILGPDDLSVWLCGFRSDMPGDEGGRSRGTDRRIVSAFAAGLSVSVTRWVGCWLFSACD